MTMPVASTRSVIVEKEFPYPPEKVWRALTEGPLIDQWLMKNDFQPVAGHRFKLSAEWGSVDCEVLSVEPERALSYTWGAYGLESVVTWTLTRTDAGTLVRMEHAGFRQEQEQAYKGAGYGWQKFFGDLERVVGGLE
ncbi:MAG: SRPBCC domain-containing protein [Acidobacteriota bacterium]|nr:SRPBCC domain-containing protein [Acidobacteriota bacterium]